jgi:hypothetical protein
MQHITQENGWKDWEWADDVITWPSPSLQQWRLILKLASRPQSLQNTETCTFQSQLSETLPPFQLAIKTDIPPPCRHRNGQYKMQVCMVIKILWCPVRDAVTATEQNGNHVVTSSQPRKLQAKSAWYSDIFLDSYSESTVFESRTEHCP